MLLDIMCRANSNALSDHQAELIGKMLKMQVDKDISFYLEKIFVL
jgi:hypothetical protein